MAYICTRPKNSCVTCSHYRFDEDYDGYACFAQEDEKNNKEEK